MQLIKLFDEVALMSELKDDTIQLIHATCDMTPIKKLVNAYEIIDLNLEIEKRFQEVEDPVWDIPALSDLSKIRRELIIYHRIDFKPPKAIDYYNQKILTLFRQIHRRVKLTDDVLFIAKG